MWESSKKPRKQRKFKLKAELHIKQDFMHSHLSKELRKKHGKRSVGLRKGDKVKILRGEFKKLEGNVEKINLKKARVFISGIEITKKDGTKKIVALDPSKLVIMQLNLDDKYRQKILDRK